MKQKTMTCFVLSFFVGLLFFSGLFVCNLNALELQGYSITSEDIQNLSPDKLQQLPPDIQKKIEQSAPLKPDSDLSKEDPDKKDPGKKDSLDKDDSPKGVSARDSIIEQQYRNGYPSILSSDLRQFGYNVFDSASIKPSSLAIPDPGYVLGTGDQLTIRLWGRGMDAEYAATVDREGAITVPRIGMVYVAGVKYKDIETVLKKEAEKYVQGINLGVTLTRLRSLEIFVVGAVSNPGLHVVPAFSTVFDALLSAGGVLKTGSLRQIKLNRADKQIRVFDLYDLLLKGKSGTDEILRNKDVIFVPGIGKTAAVAGAVNNEGIFELNKEKNIHDIVRMAGGVLPQAMGSRIYLHRFGNYQSFTISDITSDSPDEWKNVEIQNGDLVELTFSFSGFPNVIRLEGHVWNPDVFEFKNNMKLSDVLTTPNLLKPDAITDFALIERYDPDTTRFTPFQFPLSKVFTGDYDALFQPFDRIRILSLADMGIRETFSISGAVWQPGEFHYKSGLKLADALALAGGVKFGARTERVEIARQQIKEGRVQTEYILLDISKNSDFLLSASDAILVPEIKNASRVDRVAITGEVAYPGTYVIREGEKISDLIRRAGGFSEYAYFYGAKYTSENARQIQQRSIDQMIEQLRLSIMQATSQKAQTAVSEEDVQASEVTETVTRSLLAQLSAIKAEGRISFKMADLSAFQGSMYDFGLKNGDAIHIPPKPSFVSVVGSVYSPGSFLHEPNQTLDYYLSKSGGATKTADKKYIYLLKANGEILSMSQDNGFFTKFGSTVLMPGDTIVVPENLERFAYLRFIKDIADIVFKIATTAGVALSIAL